MTASKNFFSKPFGVFLIVAIIVGIGVGIYFGVKDNNNTGTTNTLNFGQNFRVTYYNTGRVY